MKRRCYSPTDNRYDKYGGRGIRVCDRWLHDFAAFYDDMGPRPSPKHSLDRIDVDGNYEPGNCRWATDLEQMNNTTRNIYVEHQGRRMTLKQVSRAEGVNYLRLWKWHVLRGEPLNAALQKIKRHGAPSDRTQHECVGAGPGT